MATDSSSISGFLSNDQYRNRVIQRAREQMPFFIEVVDENNHTVPVKFGNDTVVGIQLLINPTSLSQNLSKMVNRQQTMSAWVEEHWGEELDTVTLNGNSASFILGGTNVRDITLEKVFSSDSFRYRAYLDAAAGVPDSVVPFNPGKTGLTVQDRRYTASYDELRRLIAIMSNMCQYDDLGLVTQRNFIQFVYDYAGWRGYIESLDTIEDAAIPYRYTYVLTFKAERTLYSFRQKNAR